MFWESFFSENQHMFFQDFWQFHIGFLPKSSMSIIDSSISTSKLFISTPPVVWILSKGLVQPVTRTELIQTPQQLMESNLLAKSPHTRAAVGMLLQLMNVADADKLIHLSSPEHMTLATEDDCGDYEFVNPEENDLSHALEGIDRSEFAAYCQANSVNGIVAFCSGKSTEGVSAFWKSAPFSNHYDARLSKITESKEFQMSFTNQHGFIKTFSF